MAQKVHFQQVAGAASTTSTYGQNPADPVGSVWYVDSTSTAAIDNSSTNGFSPEAPLATIAYAVATAAKAANGDIVRVMPGHSETLIAAAQINMNKAGVSVIGSGIGRLRPIVNYTTSTAASFDINAANCSVENITFAPLGIDAVANAINVIASDFMLKNCEIEHGNSTNQAANCILTTAAANRMVIDGCFFHGSTDAGTNSTISLVGGNEITIKNCKMYGSYHASNGVILGSTTDSFNISIDRCTIINRTASSTKVIVLTASTTGAIQDCIFGVLSGTAPVTAAAIDTIGRNYYKAAVGVAAGTLV